MKVPPFRWDGTCFDVANSTGIEDTDSDSRNTNLPISRVMRLTNDEIRQQDLAPKLLYRSHILASARHIFEYIPP